VQRCLVRESRVSHSFLVPLRLWMLILTAPQRTCHLNQATERMQRVSLVSQAKDSVLFLFPVRFNAAEVRFKVTDATGKKSYLAQWCLLGCDAVWLL
jgi:hypothetical protein